MGRAMNIKKLWFIAQVHRPTTWVFFYVGKDKKIEYALSNFSLYFYHMKSHFPLFSKLLEEKEYAKAKYLEGENSLEN